MIFMTRKKFEEEVDKRMREWQRHEDHEREIRNVWQKVYQMEDHILRLERKGKMDGVAVEVCDVKDT